MEQVSQGMVMAPSHELDRAQAHRGIVEAVLCRPGVRLNDPRGCLQTEDICGSMTSLMLATVKNSGLKRGSMLACKLPSDTNVE